MALTYQKGSYFTESSCETYAFDYIRVEKLLFRGLGFPQTPAIVAISSGLHSEYASGIEGLTSASFKAEHTPSISLNHCLLMHLH